MLLCVWCTPKGVDWLDNAMFVVKCECCRRETWCVLIKMS